MTTLIGDGLEKIDGRFVEDGNGCWIWNGARISTNYGCVMINGSSILVHRLSWEIFKGEIPKGYEIDHLCRNPPCFNPEHIEPVTHAENARRGFGASGINYRKTRCPNGHEFSEHAYIRPDGYGKFCKACSNERSKEYHNANREHELERMREYHRTKRKYARWVKNGTNLRMFSKWLIRMENGGFI